MMSPTVAAAEWCSGSGNGETKRQRFVAGSYSSTDESTALSEIPPIAYTFSPAVATAEEAAGVEQAMSPRPFLPLLELDLFAVATIAHVCLAQRGGNAAVDQADGDFV